ncbi:MAG: hypothetical protein ACE5EY_03835 [Anaerolineae bacterium]
MKSKRPSLGAGDIIGFSGNSWLSAGINLATYGIPFWNLSHLGILGEFRGELVLFESTSESTLECFIQKRLVCGTQAHRLIDCVREYGGRVWHYPLSRKLARNEVERLSSFLVQYLGVHYDAIGAFRAGGVGFSWLESKLREEDLSSLFCSEFCAAAHSRVGIFPTDNASRWSPNKFVRAERRCGVLQKPWRLK